jgi:hypothetical protein
MSSKSAEVNARASLARSMHVCDSNPANQHSIFRRVSACVCVYVFVLISELRPLSQHLKTHGVWRVGACSITILLFRFYMEVHDPYTQTG